MKRSEQYFKTDLKVLVKTEFGQLTQYMHNTACLNQAVIVKSKNQTRN